MTMTFINKISPYILPLACRDVETWMWPNWLIFQPAIARDVLQYRLNRVKPAAANSIAHGFQGLMFPWSV